VEQALAAAVGPAGAEQQRAMRQMGKRALRRQVVQQAVTGGAAVAADLEDGEAPIFRRSSADCPRPR
jgi:hypothetical protein